MDLLPERALLIACEDLEPAEGPEGPGATRWSLDLRIAATVRWPASRVVARLLARRTSVGGLSHGSVSRRVSAPSVLSAALATGRRFSRACHCLDGPRLLFRSLEHTFECVAS